MAKLEELRKDFAAAEAVARSADFPAPSASSSNDARPDAISTHGGIASRRC